MPPTKDGPTKENGGNVFRDYSEKKIPKRSRLYDSTFLYFVQSRVLAFEVAIIYIKSLQKYLKGKSKGTKK